MMSNRVKALAALLPLVTMAPVASAQSTQSRTEIDGQPGQPPQAQPPQAQAPSQETPPQLSPQMRADITTALQYPLAPDFMNRASATLIELSQNGIQPPSTQGMSLRATIHRMGEIPELGPILQEHGFTIDSFVLGMTTFGMTLAASNGQLPAGFPAPNPANVALFRAHPDQVNALMQTMGNPPR